MSPSKKKKGGSLKKGFALSRDSAYTADPITELAIIGGTVIKEPNERGDLDTDFDEASDGLDGVLDDRHRLCLPLDPGFLADVHQFKVRTPITIAKINDMPVVIDGRNRVRAARASNRQRAKEGLPPISVKCVVERDPNKLKLLGAVIASNNARRDDPLSDRIDKLKRYLDLGASEQMAAERFNVGVQTIRGWLAFDDHATDETKRAAREGRLSASAAAELAKIKNPDAQRAALTRMLGAPNAKTRSARAVRRAVEGNERTAATDRRSQVALLHHLQERQATRPDIDHRYWAGVYQTLLLVTGRAEKMDVPLDEALVKSLQTARVHLEKRSQAGKAQPRARDKASTSAARHADDDTDDEEAGNDGDSDTRKAKTDPSLFGVPIHAEAEVETELAGYASHA